MKKYSFWRKWDAKSMCVCCKRRRQWMLLVISVFYWIMYKRCATHTEKLNGMGHHPLQSRQIWERGVRDLWHLDLGWGNVSLRRALQGWQLWGVGSCGILGGGEIDGCEPWTRMEVMVTCPHQIPACTVPHIGEILGELKYIRPPHAQNIEGPSILFPCPCNFICMTMLLEKNYSLFIYNLCVSI